MTDLAAPSPDLTTPTIAASDAIAAPKAPSSSFIPAKLITLQNAAGLQIQVLDYGATLLSCSLPLPSVGRRELILGCGSLEEYQRQTAYLGATVGRYANRIGGAKFVLDGEEIKLHANEGVNQLHAGPDGFDRRTWTIDKQTEHSVTFSLVSPDGDQGYPGELIARVTYALGHDLSLTISYEATTSKACPVNLTHHAYFNLDGDTGVSTTNVLDHHLQIAASHWLPVDAFNIPVGDFASVEGTGFDLRTARRLADAVTDDTVLQSNRGFDHCFAFDVPEPAEAQEEINVEADSSADTAPISAELTSGDGRVRMQLTTDAPALQVYNGGFVAGTPARDGTSYRMFAGIALEPQFAPDSPNREVNPPMWPDSILRPGQVFRRSSVLRFLIS